MTLGFASEQSQLGSTYSTPGPNDQAHSAPCLLVTDSAACLFGSQLKAMAAFAILQTFTVCLLMVVVAIFGEGARVSSWLLCGCAVLAFA